jgi:hypothetical protein
MPTEVSTSIVSTDGSGDTGGVAMLSDGDYVVAWSTPAFDPNQVSSNTAVDARIYGSNGEPAGAEFSVDSAGFDDSSVTALSNGGFVVGTNDGSDAVVQLFSSGGAKVGSEVIFDIPGNRFAEDPDAVTLSDGTYWVGFDSDAAVYAQHFSANGSPLGSLVQLSNEANVVSFVPLASGGFAADFNSFNSDFSVGNVSTEQFSASGASLGPAVNASAQTVDEDDFAGPSIAALASGGYVIVWEAPGAEGSDPSATWAIFGQIYNASGVAVGGNFQVNATPSNDDRPAVTGLSDGGFVVGWTQVDGETTETVLQRYGATGQPIGDQVLSSNETGALALGELPNDQFVLLASTSNSIVQVRYSAGMAADTDAFNGNAKSDILIESTAGSVYVGEVTGGQIGYSAVASLGSEWTFKGTGDFMGDGKEGFLIENTSGAVYVGEVSAGSTTYFGVASLGSEWSFEGTGDFLGSGKDQFLIENTSGEVVVGQVVSGLAQYTAVASLGPEWKFVGTGDYIGDGKSDFLIENTAGAVYVGEVTDGQTSYTAVASLGSEWKFVETGDFMGDGKSDFLIENTSGAVYVGEVVGGVAQYTAVAALGSEWSFVGEGDYSGTGKDSFVIENTSGAVYTGTVVSGVAQYAQIAALGSEWKFHG